MVKVNQELLQNQIDPPIITQSSVLHGSQLSITKFTTAHHWLASFFVFVFVFVFSVGQAVTHRMYCSLPRLIVLTPL
jgi:hypothetical protein